MDRQYAQNSLWTKPRQNNASDALIVWTKQFMGKIMERERMQCTDNAQSMQKLVKKM